MIVVFLVILLPALTPVVVFDLSLLLEIRLQIGIPGVMEI
jgi:hypothetical protein